MFEDLSVRPIDVSIIIPVYNGSHLLQKHLSPFLQHLHASPLNFEVIVVDDGSRDHEATGQYAEQNQLRFCQLPTNKGKGAALREGFKMANGNLQLFTDADIPFVYSNVDQFIDELQLSPDQLVVGDRTDPRSVYYEQSSFLRNIASDIVSLLVNTFFMKGIRDTQCGLKGMGKQVAQKLFATSVIDRFAIDIELIFLATKSDIPIKKLPVQLRYNDKSTVHAIDGLRLIRDIYRIKSLHGHR